ncbi:MAG TPA: aminotransferase class I/II-fold pyridoxal phosphate-dependent enzyme, partial [Longimicrobium sp.]|nr:aminotransferase class I/II-fold pyridoxal phosphate-dependent enzyme [Longimicrobium sp.]
CIVAVVLGGAEETVRAGAALRERGFLVGAVRPPTVPPGTSRLRLTVTAAHTEAHVDALLEALTTVLQGTGYRGQGTARGLRSIT